MNETQCNECPLHCLVSGESMEIIKSEVVDMVVDENNNLTATLLVKVQCPIEFNSQEVLHQQEGQSS